MQVDKDTPDAQVEARRRFLATCGKFAIATPPAITLLLAQSNRNYVFAGSGRGHHGGGGGGGFGGGFGGGHKGGGHNGPGHGGGSGRGGRH